MDVRTHIWEAAMLHRITTIAGVTVAAAVGIGAVALASSHGRGHAAGGPSVSSTIIRSETAMVGGKTETVLADAHGMPLYYYSPDTAQNSQVAGRLAALWPPVTSAKTPTARGLSGK